MTIQEKKWHSRLSLAELWYNSSFHTALSSHFRALYVIDPNVSALPNFTTTDTPVSDMAMERQSQLDALILLAVVLQ
jgi:hypothetical protein